MLARVTGGSHVYFFGNYLTKCGHLQIFGCAGDLVGPEEATTKRTHSGLTRPEAGDTPNVAWDKCEFETISPFHYLSYL